MYCLRLLSADLGPCLCQDFQKAMRQRGTEEKKLVRGACSPPLNEPLVVTAVCGSVLIAGLSPPLFIPNMVLKTSSPDIVLLRHVDRGLV